MTIYRYNVKIEILNLELSDLVSISQIISESAEFNEQEGDSIFIETVKQE